MAHYRFYTLNGDNRIEGASDHEFGNDDAAWSAAIRMMTDKPIEAWQSTRIVFRAVPPTTKPQSG